MKKTFAVLAIFPIVLTSCGDSGDYESHNFSSWKAAIREVLLRSHLPLDKYGALFRNELGDESINKEVTILFDDTFLFNNGEVQISSLIHFDVESDLIDVDDLTNYIDILESDSELVFERTTDYEGNPRFIYEYSYQKPPKGRYIVGGAEYIVIKRGGDHFDTTPRIFMSFSNLMLDYIGEPEQ